MICGFWMGVCSSLGRFLVGLHLFSQPHFRWFPSNSCSTPTFGRRGGRDAFGEGFRKAGQFFVGQSWLPKRGFLDQPDHAISCPLPHLESSLQSLWAPHIVMDAGDRRLHPKCLIFVADPKAWRESRKPEIGRLHLGLPVLPCDTPVLLAVSLFMHSPTSPSVALVLFQSMSHHVHSFSISFFRFQWGLDSIFALHFVHNWAQNWTFNSCLLLLSFPPPTYN